jgi:hypothetical protein
MHTPLSWATFQTGNGSQFPARGGPLVHPHSGREQGAAIAAIAARAYVGSARSEPRRSRDWGAMSCSPSNPDHRPGRRLDLLQSVSRGAPISGLPGSRICYGLSGCSPSCTDQTDLLGHRSLYFPRFQRGGSPLPLLGMATTSDWIPLLAGLSRAGMAASLAAPDRCGRR